MKGAISICMLGLVGGMRHVMLSPDPIGSGTCCPAAGVDQRTSPTTSTVSLMRHGRPPTRHGGALEHCRSTEPLVYVLLNHREWRSTTGDEAVGSAPEDRFVVDCAPHERIAPGLHANPVCTTIEDAE